MIIYQNDEIEERGLDSRLCGGGDLFEQCVAVIHCINSYRYNTSIVSKKKNIVLIDHNLINRKHCFQGCLYQWRCYQWYLFFIFEF